MARKITRKERLIEKIPPLVALLVVLSPVLGALIAPRFTAYVVIVFNIYFLYKSISYFFLVVLAVIRIRTTEQINWMRRLNDITHPEEGISRLTEELNKVRS